MDKIELLGEIDPLTLTGATPSNDAANNRQWLRAFLFDPKILLIDNIPFESVDLKTLTCSFKIEYLHINYSLPGLTEIPQSELEPLAIRRESTITKQVKTANFKREFNPLTPYAAEITLSRERTNFLYRPSEMPNYMDQFEAKRFREMTKGVNYSNEDFIKFFPPTDELLIGSFNDFRITNGDWVQQYPGETRTLLDYPINEYLYNGGLPGFLDLLPYLIQNGSLIFNGLDHTIFINTDICKLGSRNNQMIVNGGYSGTAYFKERVKKIIHNLSLAINAPLVVTQLLPETPKRALIYLTNNTNKKLYFSFTDNVTAQSPYINPLGTLTWEHGDIINLDGNAGHLQHFDKRSIFGLPLYVKSESGATGTVNCEQYIYDY
ncbi:MAG: hypothetical protein ACRC78_03945 [Planktothrix sp.]